MPFAPTTVASPSLNLSCAQLGEGHFLESDYGSVMSFGGYVAPIDKVDGANVAFTGTSNMPVGQYGPGNVDRVTGTVIATTMSKGVGPLLWELSCKPATRLF